MELHSNNLWIIEKNIFGINLILINIYISMIKELYYYSRFIWVLFQVIKNENESNVNNLRVLRPIFNRKSYVFLYICVLDKK